MDDAERDRPILILATGQRCGSTVLQRVLSTHPDVFIWGEHAGALGPMLTAADTFAGWSNNQAARANEEFASAGTAAFMANMAPTEEVLRTQVHSMLRGLFRRLPDGAAPPAGFRWGFKEVRYDAGFVRRFARYFPDTRVVYLTRDPVAVLRSLDWWEQTSGGLWYRERTEATFRMWCDINASFLAAPDLAGTVLPVRYEELTGAREATLSRICHFLDVPEDELDHGVLDDVVHAPAPWGRRQRDLRPRSAVVADFRELFADPDNARIMAAVGYPVSDLTDDDTSMASTDT